MRFLEHGLVPLRTPTTIDPFAAIYTRPLDLSDRVLYLQPAMMFLTHTRWHRGEVETTPAAAVYLRPECDSFSKRSALAQISANGMEPDP